MTLPDVLHLEIQKEALSDGAVPAVSFAATAADEAVAGQQALLRLAGILPPPVRIDDQSERLPRTVRRKIQQPATGILKQNCLDIYVHLSAGASVLPLDFCCPICGQKFFLK